jgi:hypothetical protein
MRSTFDLHPPDRIFAWPPHYFTLFRPPDPARARRRWTCANFQGRFYADHLPCERDGHRHVVGVPRDGCAFWQRELGADDE